MMFKTKVEDKVSFIDLMIRLMKEKGLKGFEILQRTVDVDKCYEKALRYNRINGLISLSEMKNCIMKVEMESNEDFVKGIEDADKKVIKLVKKDVGEVNVRNDVKVVETPNNKVVKPTLSNVDILVEALSMGIEMYDIGFLNMLGTDNVKVGFKDDKTCVYYVREIGKFINVNE